MARNFRHFASLLAPGGKMFCIAGDVRIRATVGANKRSRIIRLGEVLAEVCSKACPNLRVADYDSHVVNRTSRYLHAINKTNGHKDCALIERIFIAEKR
jgi:hypothetical protein